MVIASEPGRTGRERRKTTLALPAHLLDLADREVESGNAESGAALIAGAIEREMKRRERLATDDNLRQMKHDARYLAEQESIMAGFAGAGAETARAVSE